MRAPVTHPAGRTGLIGTVLCIGILAVVARLAAPDPTFASQVTSGERLAFAVDSVRTMVGAHRLSNSAPVTPTGWPKGISPAWFPNGVLPTHPETGQPFLVEVVDGAPSLAEPADPTFDRREVQPRTLWYNRTNGAICARVVDDGDPMSAVVRFAQANRHAER